MAAKERTRRSYQQEIRKLKAMIASMLWVQPTYNGSPSCAYCGEQQHQHAKHCQATKLVADTWPLEDQRRVDAVSRG